MLGSKISQSLRPYDNLIFCFVLKESLLSVYHWLITC